MAQPYSHWTDEEKTLIEDWMTKISPGFRLYNEAATLQEVAGIMQGQKWKADLNPLLVVRNILRKDLTVDSDLPEPWFWILFWRLLSRRRYAPDPWYEVKWWLWSEVRGKSRCINFLGSQNSIKSFWSAWFTIVQGFVWDSDCLGYVSGPIKLDTEDKVWQEVLDFFDEVVAVNGGAENLEQLFGILINRTELELNISSRETGTGTGTIKFVASQKSSSVRGKKTKKHGEGRKGIVFLVIDEYSENVHTYFSKGWNNLKSNPNAALIIGTNPDPDNVNHANLIKYIDPLTLKRQGMNRSDHFRWRTGPGLVSRFEELNCPNFLLNRTEYDYMLNQRRRDNMEHDTEAEKAAQLFAWPFGAGGIESLTDAARQHAAGVFTPFLYESQDRTRFLGLDPSFGGTDPAVYTILDKATISYEGTHQPPVQRLVAIEQAEIPHITNGYVIDRELYRIIQSILKHRLNILNHSSELQWIKDLQIGDVIEGAAHCAILAAEICLLKNVPFQNVTFDSSQRASCGDWVFKIFGRDCFSWYYEGSRTLTQEESPDWLRWPYRTFEDRDGTRYEKFSDTTANTISMLWKFACEIINEGMVINGSAIQRGLDELQTRAHGKNANGRLQVASKQNIKDGKFQGRAIPKMKSPAWAETLAITIYYACRFHNALDLGEKPQFETNEGKSSAVDEWLDLHSIY